jgi:hypothetical protein
VQRVLYSIYPNVIQFYGKSSKYVKVGENFSASTELYESEDEITKCMRLTRVLVSGVTVSVDLSEVNINAMNILD